MMKYVSNHHPPHCWIESPKVLSHIHMPYCEDFMSKPILVNEVSPLDTMEKNGSWTGPRRLWTPKPASWSRGRIQVDAKERHHQAPPCIKSRGNQGRVNLHLKAERRLKGCNPSSGDPAHKLHQSVPTSPAPSRGIIHCTPFWAQTPASRDTWMSWNIGSSLLIIILFHRFHRFHYWCSL